MKRRNFIGMLGAGSSALAAAPFISIPATSAASPAAKKRLGHSEMTADLVVAGAGMGGCACALGALRNGLSVIMTEETDWIGGQLTQQGVPFDEHRWIENTRRHPIVPRFSYGTPELLPEKIIR